MKPNHLFPSIFSSLPSTPISSPLISTIPDSKGIPQFITSCPPRVCKEEEMVCIPRNKCNLPSVCIVFCVFPLPNLPYLSYACHDNAKTSHSNLHAYVPRDRLSSQIDGIAPYQKPSTRSTKSQPQTGSNRTFFLQTQLKSQPTKEGTSKANNKAESS